MHGDGTKLAITTNNAPARLIDLTRLISRAGRMPTGIDRVELAYLLRFCESDVPCFGLARTPFGLALLEREGMRAISDRLTGKVHWGEADRLSRIGRGRSAAVRRAESDLRRLSVARCVRTRLGQMLARHLPRGTAYFNVGHSNLTPRVFQAMRDHLGATVSVMIHDTIPLDFPELQRAGTPSVFETRLKQVHEWADRVIYPSADSRSRAEAHMARWGEPPDGCVAAPGIELVVPDASALPGDLDLGAPYFVSLGTIEPRKDHALILDTWDDMIADGGDVPGLMICGARGWNNEAVFRRLDKLAAGGPIRELSRLPDPAIAALLSGSSGLIFPSRAEGYGLPPLEAAALGVPVICRDLPVYRETLGDIPVYLMESDRYLLRKLVQSLLQRPATEQKSSALTGFEPPNWDDHFRKVLERA